MAANFSFDVFLGHSSKDKAIVRPIAERLEKDGLKVWFDERVLKPGDIIPKKVEEGLENSRVLVLCISRNNLGSEWALLETKTTPFRDSSQGRLLIPLLLDDADIPILFQNYKYIDFREKTDAAYSELVTACMASKQPARVDDALQAADKMILRARESEATELGLRDMGLTQLPESLTLLTHLQRLDISYNNLTSLPASLAQLGKLQFLSVTNNQLAVLPESLAQLTELQTLHLSDNGLVALPESLAQLYQLRYLDVSNNQLTVLPESLGQLAQLHMLDVHDNQLTFLPESLAQLKQLQLNYGGNPLKRPPEWLVQPAVTPRAPGASPEKPKARPTPSRKASTPEFSFSAAAARVIKRARELAKETKRAGITSSCLLFGFAETGGDPQETASFVREVLDRSGLYTHAYATFLEDSGNPKKQGALDGGEFLGPMSRNVGNVLEVAADIASRVTGGKREIHQRHLLAALLTAPDKGAKKMSGTRLLSMKMAVDQLREELRDFIRTHDGSDHALEWDLILGPGHSGRDEAKPIESSYVSGPAGYTPEFVGVGGTTEVLDHLGVEGLARRLAELIALRETRLPLAVGLFGNWGSGKTHFMNLMDRHIKKVTAKEKERSANEDGPWCREMVAIYFNAWHYLDTNLWASLVTEIFDRLFRHVAGEADSVERRKEKIEKLLVELQKANGAAATAEENIEVARLAKAQAEAEERQADEAAQRAARQRNRLETLINRVLDNLEQLLPEGEVKESWKGALSALDLREARKSYASLTAEVAEFQSLQGRTRAIGGAILTPEGRTGRLLFLAAAMLGAPLIAGLAAWGVTYWSVEIRQVGMLMGEVTGFLAGVVGWCGVQLQRGRRLLTEVEEMERAAQNKRVLKADQPKLRRARAQVEEFAKDEAKARNQQQEARAKVRQLEEELSELRPERRLFRFIENRASAQDYRAHLGLVSLIRRDFQELSSLFAETEADRNALPAMSQKEREERADLSASIDRIVLFVDDLDRCQPDKVVDVLQAVHLLLAYPLFAVVVGVDQRVLKHSIEKQFFGLVSPGNPSGNSDHPATSLDYLEKIFHVPFHLPVMGKDGFQELVKKLTTQKMPPSPTVAEENKADLIQPASGSTSIQDQARAPDSERAVVSEAPTPASTVAQEEKKETPLPDVPPTPLPLIGSVPLEPWESKALEDYHSLISTPRGATRLLNTYRLVRAGIPENEWDEFRGNRTTHGEFRVAMLLLAAGAGNPTVARALFHNLRNPDWSENFVAEPNQSGWIEFDRAFEATFPDAAQRPNQERLTKWLDRVERFTF